MYERGSEGEKKKRAKYLNDRARTAKISYANLTFFAAQDILSVKNEPECDQKDFFVQLSFFDTCIRSL